MLGAHQLWLGLVTRSCLGTPAYCLSPHDCSLYLLLLLPLAAGPPTAGTGTGGGGRPPPLSPGGPGAHSQGLNSGAGGNSCWGTPPSHSHMPSIPSSPKPPLGRSSLDLNPGAVNTGGGSILGSSPVGDSPILGLQRGGSGGLAGSYNSNASAGGAVMMQMSPPASPRVSASHLLARGSSLGGASGHHAHRGVVRRQLVAVHESVTVLEVRGVCVLGA